MSDGTCQGGGPVFVRTGHSQGNHSCRFRNLNSCFEGQFVRVLAETDHGDLARRLYSPMCWNGCG